MIVCHREMILLLLDMLQNTLMLMMALRIERVRIRPFRVCFAAFFGGAAAFAARFSHLSRSQSVLLWFPLAMCMMHIAGGCAQSGKRLLRSALVLLSCAGFLGGVVLALYGATGSPAFAHLSSAICAGAVFVSMLRAGRAAQEARRVCVSCVVAGRVLVFDAILDSGNSLRDYLTHRPVIVAGEGVFKDTGVNPERMRLIFADTAGGRQMLRLVVPTQTTLLFEGKEISVEAALAFAPGLGKDAPALVPASLL